MEHDLRGADLRDDDLRRADLRQAALQGARLDGAVLRQADLAGCRTGLRRSALWGLGILSALFSVVLGLVAARAGDVVADLLASSEASRRLAGIIIVVGALLYSGLLVWNRGRTAALGLAGGTIFVSLTTALVAMGNRLGPSTVAVLVLVFTVALLAMVLLMALVRAVAGLAWAPLLLLVAIGGMFTSHGAGGGLAVGLFIVTATLVARRAVTRRWEAPLIGRISRTVIARFGTSFRGADLRDARFDGADLRAADFRGADLRGARFYAARGLGRCLFDRPWHST